MPSLPPFPAAPAQADEARAREAQLVNDLLARWAAEDVSDEPDWDVDQIESIAFRSGFQKGEGPRAVISSRAFRGDPNGN